MDTNEKIDLAELTLKDLLRRLVRDVDQVKKNVREIEKQQKEQVEKLNTLKEGVIEKAHQNEIRIVKIEELLDGKDRAMKVFMWITGICIPLLFGLLIYILDMIRGLT